MRIESRLTEKFIERADAEPNCSYLYRGGPAVAVEIAANGDGSTSSPRAYRLVLSQSDINAINAARAQHAAEFEKYKL